MKLSTIVFSLVAAAILSGCNMLPLLASLSSDGKVAGQMSIAPTNPSPSPSPEPTIVTRLAYTQGVQIVPVIGESQFGTDTELLVVDNASESALLITMSSHDPVRQMNFSLKSNGKPIKLTHRGWITGLTYAVGWRWGAITDSWSIVRDDGGVVDSSKAILEFGLARTKNEEFQILQKVYFVIK